MDLRISDSDAQFRAVVKEFITAELPSDIARRGKHDYHSARSDVARWMKILNRKGWSAPHWPAALGGTDWSPLQRYIFQDELRMARAPVLDRCALDLLGPVLCAFGSGAQQARFLPPILNGDEWWCQGFSEPGSGSDLASLRTRADLDGDHYVVNGSKIWTTEAHYADWLFALVRTDQTVKPQAGISFLLIDMKSPGVTVRPIRLLSGASPFNETLFEDAIAEAGDVIGGENQGWAVGKRLLQFERSTHAGINISGSQGGRVAESRMPERLRGYVGTVDGRLADPDLRDRLIRHEQNGHAQRLTQKRVIEELSARAPGFASSAVKLSGALHTQDGDELLLAAQGTRGIGWSGAGYSAEEIESTRTWLRQKSLTIAGGTQDIQRNIIAKRVLGLPD